MWMWCKVFDLLHLVMFNHWGCGKQIAQPDDVAQTKKERFNVERGGEQGCCHCCCSCCCCTAVASFSLANKEPDRAKQDMRYIHFCTLPWVMAILGICGRIAYRFRRCPESTRLDSGVWFAFSFWLPADTRTGRQTEPGSRCKFEHERATHCHRQLND